MYKFSNKKGEIFLKRMFSTGFCFCVFSVTRCVLLVHACCKMSVNVEHRRNENCGTNPYEKKLFIWLYLGYTYTLYFCNCNALFRELVEKKSKIRDEKG